jgi:hypothetical protein
MSARFWLGMSIFWGTLAALAMLRFVLLTVYG